MLKSGHNTYLGSSQLTKDSFFCERSDFKTTALNAGVKIKFHLEQHVVFERLSLIHTGATCKKWPQFLFKTFK